jgi:hypothetical protein
MMMTRFAGGALALGWIMTTAALVGGTMPVRAGADPCGGAPFCQVQGRLMAQVVKVNVTDSGGVTAYHGVRTTIRFTNLGDSSVALAYQERSSRITDDKGLDYKWSSKANGIGLVNKDSADPQFRLAPGESREASFENVLQYSTRRTVVGAVFNHDLTITALKVMSERSVHSDTDYALSFSGLTASSGVGAGAPVRSSMAGPPAPPPAGSLPVMGNPCDGQPSCQAQGPLFVRVTGVNVTDSGGVTAYHSVRTTLRIQNVGNEPLTLGYRVGTAAVSDDHGLAYAWGRSGTSEARYVHGIGEISKNSADTQFRLAPGESRDVSFDRILQYNTRRTSPGRVFTFDLTLVQLAVVGNRQVESLHDYALSFSNLFAGQASGAPGANVNEVAHAAGQLLNLLKGAGK